MNFQLSESLNQRKINFKRLKEQNQKVQLEFRNIEFLWILLVNSKVFWKVFFQTYLNIEFYKVSKTFSLRSLLG